MNIYVAKPMDGLTLRCDMSGWYDNGKTVVEINGIKKQRKVYYSSECGFYILVNGYKIFEYEFN